MPHFDPVASTSEPACDANPSAEEKWSAQEIRGSLVVPTTRQDHGKDDESVSVGPASLLPKVEAPCTAPGVDGVVSARPPLLLSGPTAPKGEEPTQELEDERAPGERPKDKGSEPVKHQALGQSSFPGEAGGAGTGRAVLTPGPGHVFSETP